MATTNQNTEELNPSMLQQLLQFMVLNTPEPVNEEHIANNKSLIIKSTSKNQLLVCGFINKFCNSILPNDIIKMINNYFLKLLFINNYKNINNVLFLWHFNTKSDINLYLNAKNGDVLTSCKFSINGCVFYLELTPNGWGRYNNLSAVWCALLELPNNISKIKVYFQYKCHQIDYIGEETKILTTAKASQSSGGVWSIAPPKTHGSMDKFKNFDSFTFECLVKVIGIYDNKGDEVLSIKDKLERIITEEVQRNGKSRSGIIKQLQYELAQLK